MICNIARKRLIYCVVTDGKGADGEVPENALKYLSSWSRNFFGLHQHGERLESRAQFRQIST